MHLWCFPLLASTIVLCLGLGVKRCTVENDDRFDTMVTQQPQAVEHILCERRGRLVVEVVVPLAFAPHQSGTPVDGFMQPRVAVDHGGGLLNTLLFEQRHDLLQRRFRRQVVLFHLRKKTINPLAMVVAVSDKKNEQWYTRNRLVTWWQMGCGARY